MARTPDDKLTVANQNFRCTDCGRCCRDWYVALLPDDKRRLSKLQWRQEDQVPENFIATVNKKEYIAHRSDGTCIYFDRDAGNCMIHARHGEIIKPLGCRVYPFNIVAALDNEHSVMARYDCPAVRADEGQPLSQSKRQIERYIEDLCMSDGFDRYDREGLDADAIRKIVTGVYKLVIDSPALNCPAAVTAANIAAYRLEQLGADFLNDVNPNRFLESFLQRAVADSVEMSPPKHVNNVERWRFMVLFTAYMRRDESLIGQGLRARARRAGAIMRIILKTGNLHELGEEHPDMALHSRELFEMPIVNLEEVDWSLYRDMIKVRLQTYQFFGNANFNAGIYSGMQLLLLTFPLVIAAARWHAAARHRTRLELLPVDVDYAVGAIDHAFGRAQVLNMGFYRMLSRQMADIDSYRRLVWSLLRGA
jgi:Fe-S-cluster containining protein